MFAFYILFIIMDGTMLLGGGRDIGGPMRYLMANEVEWDEVQRCRVPISSLFGKFVSFIIIENIVVCLNFLD